MNVVETSGSITYKVSLGTEVANIGHFVSHEIVNGVLTLRFATKTTPAFKIEEVETFDLKFN